MIELQQMENFSTLLEVTNLNFFGNQPDINVYSWANLLPISITFKS